MLLLAVQIVKRRKWEVNEPKIDEFLDKIKDGVYILLYGPCASGKSTHIIYAIQKLQKEGYHCIYLDFTEVNVKNDEKAMWRSFQWTLESQCPKGIVNNEFYEMIHFINTFSKEKWDHSHFTF
nr:8547_t:CDS:2 [Entrophospora candida]